MELHEVRKMYELHWKKGWGSITAMEAMFIQDKIREYRPARFIEIGMASGMSGGLIARFLHEYGQGKLVTLDHDNTFFGDKTKENGFLIESILEDVPATVTKKPFTIALDIGDIEDGPFDMAFVDANHYHPWPLMDTMCLYPFMCGSRLVIHHDRQLYKNQEIVYGIGPKYLFDQFPCDRREVPDNCNGNIFAINMDMDKAELEEIFIDAIYLPWSSRNPLHETHINRFADFLQGHYSDKALTAFAAAAQRFNRQDRLPGCSPNSRATAHSHRS